MKGEFDASIVGIVALSMDASSVFIVNLKSKDHEVFPSRGSRTWSHGDAAI